LSLEVSVSEKHTVSIVRAEVGMLGSGRIYIGLKEGKSILTTIPWEVIPTIEKTPEIRNRNPLKERIMDCSKVLASHVKGVGFETNRSEFFHTFSLFFI
jgi:hypothetical protein